MMTLDWQKWIVAFIVVAALIRLVFVSCRFFRRTKNKENPCANCTSGCALRDQYEKQQQQCKETKLSDKKKCCG